MGSGQSKEEIINGDSHDGTLGDEKMAEFNANTHFTPSDIQTLLLVYKKIGGSIDEGKDGLIQFDEFTKNIKFSNPDIAMKIYKMIDVDGDSNIQFDEFVYGLNVFHPDSDINLKVEKCFQAYDDDGSGAISKEEVDSIIDMSLQNNTFVSLDPSHRKQLLDDLFDKYDTSGDPDGNMSLGDFRKMVLQAPGILDSFQFDMGMLPSPDELKYM